jgi:hypothetical protein
MKQFEYIDVDITEFASSKRAEELTKLGKEGWEAVSGHGINNCLFLFKREIENEAMEQSHESHPLRYRNEFDYSR